VDIHNNKATKQLGYGLEGKAENLNAKWRVYDPGYIRRWLEEI